MTLRFQGEWLLLGIKGPYVYGLATKVRHLSGSDFRWSRRFSGIRPDMMVYIEGFGSSEPPNHYLLSNEEVLTVGQDNSRLLVSPFTVPTDIDLVRERLRDTMGSFDGTATLVHSILYYPSSLGGLSFATTVNIATDRPAQIEYNPKADAFDFVFKP